MKCARWLIVYHATHFLKCILHKTGWCYCVFLFFVLYIVCSEQSPSWRIVLCTFGIFYSRINSLDKYRLCGYATTYYTLRKKANIFDVFYFWRNRPKNLNFENLTINFQCDTTHTHDVRTTHIHRRLSLRRIDNIYWMYM